MDKNTFPKLTVIRQNIAAKTLSNISETLFFRLETIKASFPDITGKSVGITAGSRGIDNFSVIIKCISGFIKECGGNPVIIPAMGSHGGATTSGQLEVLEGIGITESFVGAPIHACAESINIAETDNNIPVYCSTEALKLDHIIVVNRIKPHTDFTGDIESGILKIMAIGMGNQAGAETVHAHGLKVGLESVIKSVAEVMLEKLPILLAVGIIENWQGKTEKIEVMLPEEIMLKEPDLLKYVKANTIKLPFDHLHTLIVDEIGKNISGAGMDTKVIGRIRLLGQPEPEKPKIERICVLKLTPESHGNALGIGMADITTQNVFKSIDIKSTVINGITSMSPDHAAIPAVVDNDREAILAAIKTSSEPDLSKIRLVYILNTLRLDKMAVSEVLLKEVETNDRLEIIKTNQEIQFDENGALIKFDMWF